MGRPCGFRVPAEPEIVYTAASLTRCRAQDGIAFTASGGKTTGTPPGLHPGALLAAEVAEAKVEYPVDAVTAPAPARRKKPRPAGGVPEGKRRVKKPTGGEPCLDHMPSHKINVLPHHRCKPSLHGTTERWIAPQGRTVRKRCGRRSLRLRPVHPPEPPWNEAVCDHVLCVRCTFMRLGEEPCCCLRLWPWSWRGSWQYRALWPH